MALQDDPPLHTEAKPEEITPLTSELSRSDAAARASRQEPKAKVFISYSRKDIAFADRLDAALKARGFEPLIDRTDIYAFEEWWKRVEDLIGRADTVVFVLSPDAVRPGSVSLKEVSFAASLNKRFAPIVFRPVQDKDVPEALAKLNFIFFDDPAQFEQSADKLAEALNTNISWIRQHTDFGEQARRWALATGPTGLLLRSPVLEQAERWIASRPPGAPAPTDETQTFIRRSRQAATRRRNILTGSLAAGLVLALGLAGIAYWQRGIAVEQQQVAQRERDRAVQAEQTATEQKEIAQQQRDRAERTLATATKTANSMVNDLAVEFRDRSGMPIDLVRKILDRARGMQRQLTQSGEMSSDLGFSETFALLQLTMTYLAQGDSAAALGAINEARETGERFAAANPADDHWQRELSVIYSRLGWVLEQDGRLADALAAFRHAVAIREKLTADDPDNKADKRNLAVGYAELAGVLLSQDSERALEYYRSTVALLEQLAASSDHADAQRDLAHGLSNMAQALSTAGQFRQALDMYRRSLAIAEKLAAGDPGNTAFQLDLTRYYGLLGMVLTNAGLRKEAFEVYSKDQQVLETLAKSDPGNAEWQRELGVVYEHAGSLLLEDGRPEDALASMQKGIAVREKLAAADPKRLEWQRDLSVSYTNVGDLLDRQDKDAEALDYYRRGMRIREQLVAAQPDNPEWQVVLAISSERLGDMLRDSGKRAEALALYRRSMAIREKLAAGDPANAQYQRGLTFPYDRVARELLQAGKRAEGIELLRKGLAINEQLLAANPEDTYSQMQVVFSLYQLGKAGESAQDNFSRALKMLRQIEAEGKLEARLKGMGNDIEGRLAALPK